MSVIIAVDIERSGPYTLDCIFAIGLAWQDGDKIKSTKLINRAVSNFTGSWRDTWKANKWDMDTFDNFWSKNEDKLFDMDEDCNLAAEFESFLEEMEKKYTNIQFLFDTAHFDAVYLSMLLLEHGKKPIHLSRDGKRYHGSIELDSYVAGVKKFKPEFQMPETQNHDPEVDAKAILINYLAASA